MIHALKIAFQLKWLIAKRIVRSIPLMYLVVLSVFIVLVAWALITADIAVTWKSLSIVAIVQLFSCSQLRYRNNKKEFLRQFPRLYLSSLWIDVFLTTLPFLLIHPLCWMTAACLALLYMLFLIRINNEIHIKKPHISSPFFVKSSYLWHSQFRVFVPAVWLFIVVISVIARVHDNFNLAIVVFYGGAFISILAIIFQKEERDFVTIYLNARHFMRRTLEEIVMNTVIFTFPIAILLLFLFPSEWKIIGLSFLSLHFISVNMLWIKYIFYPSLLLAGLFFFVGIAIQAACVFSIYGIALIPFYYYALYFFCRKRVGKYFIENERIDY